MFKEISVIGLGLMGASIAGAVKSLNNGIKVKGYDVAVENIRFCLTKGLIDDTVDFKSGGSPAGDVESLIIMCAPPTAIIGLMEENAAFFKNAAYITDIGSVKETIAAHAAAENIKNFVGSHPMCGSDKSGPQNADFNLFNGKNCIVMRENADSNDTGRKEKIDKISGFWTMLKMNVFYSTAKAHDDMAAYASHLPHLVAFLLSGAVLSRAFRENRQENKPENDASLVNFIGNGFKDSTRIASSSPELWTDIFLMNGGNITASLEGFIAAANIIKGFIETGDRESLTAELKKITSERAEAGL